MKAALIAVSALAGALAIALVVVVLGGTIVTTGGLPELESEGDAPPSPKEDGPIRRVATEINDGSGWKDVDLEVELLEARTANPPRDKTIGIEESDSRWITAELEVRNRADDATDDGPTLVAVDSDGQTYDAGGLDNIVEPSLGQLSVPARGRRKGFLSVQVPEKAKIERLEARFIGEPVGWNLDTAL